MPTLAVKTMDAVNAMKDITQMTTESALYAVRHCSHVQPVVMQIPALPVQQNPIYPMQMVNANVTSPVKTTCF